MHELISHVVFLAGNCKLKYITQWFLYYYYYCYYFKTLLLLTALHNLQFPVPSLLAWKGAKRRHKKQVHCVWRKAWRLRKASENLWCYSSTPPFSWCTVRRTTPNSFRSEKKNETEEKNSGLSGVWCTGAMAAHKASVFPPKNPAVIDTNPLVVAGCCGCCLPLSTNYLCLVGNEYRFLVLLHSHNFGLNES